jgi:hypothetical protein
MKQANKGSKKKGPKHTQTKKGTGTSQNNSRNLPNVGTSTPSKMLMDMENSAEDDGKKSFESVMQESDEDEVGDHITDDDELE